MSWLSTIRNLVEAECHKEAVFGDKWSIQPIAGGDPIEVVAVFDDFGGDSLNEIAETVATVEAKKQLEIRKATGLTLADLPPGPSSVFGTATGPTPDGVATYSIIAIRSDHRNIFLYLGGAQ